MESQGWGQSALPSWALPWGHSRCGPSSQPLSPTVHGGTHGGVWSSSCSEEQGAAAIPGWALGEVGGLDAASRWVLWGEMSVQGLRKEWAKLGCGAGLLCGAGAGDRWGLWQLVPVAGQQHDACRDLS